MPAVRLVFPTRELHGKILKGRQNYFAQPFEGLGQFGVFHDLKGFSPFCAVPATGECFIFKPVNSARAERCFRFVRERKTGLQCGEPVIVRPVERDRAERAAGQFSQGVMRHRFPPVEKERNPVATKHTRQRLVIAVEIPHEHGGIAKTSAATNEAPDFARGACCFGVGV